MNQSQSDRSSVGLSIRFAQEAQRVAEVPTDAPDVWKQGAGLEDRASFQQPIRATQAVAEASPRDPSKRDVAHSVS
jgi:hypothetical protein